MKRKFTKTRTLLTLLVLAQPMLATASDHTLYINGKVITVNKGFEIAEAFAVDGDRFELVGNTKEVLALRKEGTTVVDLQGRTVIPGLIDNHNHFIRGAQHWNMLVRLDGVSTRAEATARLRAKAAELQPEHWLLALGGWNEQQFSDDPIGYTRLELDAIAKVPAFLQSQYSHTYVNTAFLEYFGLPIKADTVADLPDHPILGPPLAELVERDAAGVATGRINGGLMMVIQVGLGMPEVQLDDAIMATKAAQHYYHSLGLTSVYDPAGGLTTPEMYDAVEHMEKNGSLTLRTFRTLWIQPRDDDSVAAAVMQIEEASPMLRGSDMYDTIGVGEALYMPLHDSAGEVPQFGDRAREHVKTLLGAIAKQDLPVQIHAVNTETIAFYLSVLEEIRRHQPFKPGYVTFTHAEGVTKQLLKRMAKLDATVQVRSTRVVNSREWLLGELGEVAFSEPPLRVLNDNDVVWGLGTDGTKAAQIDPMITLAWAVSGKAINGDVVLSDEQRLTREEALIAHTRNNAQLLFRGDRLGQIEAGYLADFVVLNRDYMAVPTSDIAALRSVLTVVNGRTVFKQGEL